MTACACSRLAEVSCTHEDLLTSATRQYITCYLCCQGTCHRISMTEKSRQQQRRQGAQPHVSTATPLSKAAGAPGLDALARHVVPDLDVPTMSHLLFQLFLWQACAYPDHSYVLCRLQEASAYAVWMLLAEMCADLARLTERGKTHPGCACGCPSCGRTSADVQCRCLAGLSPLQAPLGPAEAPLRTRLHPAPSVCQPKTSARKTTTYFISLCKSS